MWRFSGKTRRLTGLLLAVFLLISLVPCQSIAAEAEEDIAAKTGEIQGDT